MVLPCLTSYLYEFLVCTANVVPVIICTACALMYCRLAAERAAGRVLFRGSFGTQRAGGPLANALDV